MRCAKIVEVAPLGQIIQFESDRCSVDAPSVNKLGRFLCAERLVSINILRHQMLFTYLVSLSMRDRRVTGREIQTETNTEVGLITITH